MSNIPYKFKPIIIPLNVTSGINGTFIFNANGASVSSGTIMSGAYLGINDRKTMCVYSGGSASGTVISSGGSMIVSSRGIADNTTVNSGGRCFVSSIGSASNATISSGGTLCVLSGGHASNLYISAGGSLTISSGGTCTHFCAEHANCVNLSSAFIYGATVKAGMLTLAEDNLGEAQSRFSTISAIGATIMVSSTCKVYSMYAESGGYIEIIGGASAENTVARDGGTVMFGVSGSGIGLGVYSGGTGVISSGAKVEQAMFVFSGGSAVIQSGGSCGGGIVSSGGTLFISAGGTATNITSAPGAVIIQG